LLLLRDWTDDQEDAGYEPYKCGYYDEDTQLDGKRKNFMQTTFFPDQEQCDKELTASALQCRKTILESFESTAMYLMAQPGQSKHFPKPTEDDSRNWHEDFRNCVKDFVTRLLDPTELFR